MSYPFKISVTRSVDEVVCAADKQVVKLSMTHVVPSEDMREILADRLKARGWKADGERLTKAGSHGEAMTIDLDDMTLTVVAKADEKIVRTETVETIVDSDNIRADAGLEARLQKKAGDELEKRLAITDAERAAAKGRLEAAAAKAISEGDEARRREINEVMGEVHAEAIKRKAASLGTVSDVDERLSEDGKSYDLTITITE